MPVSVPAIATATAAAGDTLVGVKAGAMRRFDINGLSPLINGAISYNGGPGIAWRMRGSDFSATTRNFNFGGSSYPNANLPGDARQNTVWNLGPNVASNGAREDVTEACFRDAWEEHYLQSGTGDAAFERHWSVFDLSGGEHRPITGYFPKAAASTQSGMNFGVDKLVFNTWNSVVKVLWNLSGNNASMASGFQFLSASPAGTVIMRQRNAADTSYVDLPYLGSEERLIANGSGMQTVGLTPTTGTYANNFAVFQATSLPSNGTLIYGQGPALVGVDANAMRLNASIAGNWNIALENASGNAVAHSTLTLQTAGTAAGDPKIKFSVVSGTQWQAGADNSTNDQFVLATADLGNGGQDKLVLTTNGDLSVSGSIKFPSYTVATLPAASLGAGTTVYVSNAAGSPCLAFSNGTNWKRCDAAGTTVT